MNRPARERIDLIDEDTLEGWRDFLTDFEEKVLPVFASHGYLRDTALLAWQLNLVKNEVIDVWFALQEEEGGIE